VRERSFMSARMYSLSDTLHTHTQHEGRCEQCGTSHVNLWGHWDSPKTACRPPSHSGDGITPSDDDAQARDSRATTEGVITSSTPPNKLDSSL